jgi:hypothetical protein
MYQTDTQRHKCPAAEASRRHLQGFHGKVKAKADGMVLKEAWAGLALDDNFLLLVTLPLFAALDNRESITKNNQDDSGDDDGQLAMVTTTYGYQHGRLGP